MAPHKSFVLLERSPTKRVRIDGFEPKTASGRPMATVARVRSARMSASALLRKSLPVVITTNRWIRPSSLYSCVGVQKGGVDDQFSRPSWLGKMTSSNTTAVHTFERACRNLYNILEQAAKFDSWGQRLEASEAYQRFCEECAEASTAGMEEEDKKIIQQVLNHARRRGELLQEQPSVSGRIDEINHQQIGADIEAMKELVVKLKRKKSLRRKLSAAVQKEIEEGGLLPALRPKRAGFTYLTVKIDKIGLKDAMMHMDPFVTVSLKDEKGDDIGPSQSTPPAELYEEKYIIFNEDVHIQKAIDEIGSNAAIFFEFKHFKPKKNKISTKCFAFLEKDEIKDGQLVLEL